MAPRKKVGSLAVAQPNAIDPQTVQIPAPIGIPEQLFTNPVEAELMAIEIQQSVNLGHKLADHSNAVIRGAIAYVETHGNDQRYRQNAHLLVEALRASSVIAATRFNESDSAVLSAIQNPSIVDRFFAPAESAESEIQTDLVEG